MELWRDVWASYPPGVLNAGLDRYTIQRLCEAAEERQSYLDVLERLGPVQIEPLISPSGAVVGERLAANPAAAMLRRVTKEIDNASAALGLHPQSRARLGLDLSRAQLAANSANAILASMYAKERQA
jgi:P27 family predicted phage terminase small subunit